MGGSNVPLTPPFLCRGLSAPECAGYTNSGNLLNRSANRMKPFITISAVAFVFVVAPSPCFAAWDVETVTKERAKELGMEIRVPAANPDQVRIELEFKLEGTLKKFGRIDLWI